MSKHTYTEWLREENTVYALNLEGSNRFVAQVQGGWATEGRLRTDESELEANARLIAAAPELLIELRQAVIQMEMAADCIQNGRYDEALLHASSLMRSKRAAIAKATGE